MIGKTNTPEFTLLGETRNRLGPDTCNPWNPQMTSGGSSGGSAAALAAGMVPLATGSDTAGSITVPAAFCGVVGFKPSHRRIPVWPGPEDWAPFADVGPMTRSITDAALMLASASGPDPRDPFSAPAFDAPAVPPRLARRLKIAFVPTLADLPVDPICAATVVECADALASLGHRVHDLGPKVENPGPALDLMGAVQEYRIRGMLLETSASLLGPETRNILASGRGASQPEVDAAQAMVTRVAAIFRAFLAEYDILLTPATACLAFPLRQPPAMIAGRAVVADWPSYAPFNMFANITGCPVATIPWRLSDSGLPVGVLAFAGYGRDALLLAALSEAEHLRGPFPLPPRLEGVDPIPRDKGGFVGADIVGNGCTNVTGDDRTAKVEQPAARQPRPDISGFAQIIPGNTVARNVALWSATDPKGKTCKNRRLIGADGKRMVFHSIWPT